MKLYSLPLYLAFMVLALAAYGQGSFIYDQSSATNRSINGGVSIQEEQPVGQSFTPALSSVGFVQLEFLDAHPGNGLGATVYVNLRADSITGTILASTDPVAMPDGFSYGITNFFFSTPAAVTPGTTYYFQPVVQSGDSQWAIIAGSYSYPGGTFFVSGLPDPLGDDAWFREGALTPEPSSGLLVLAGIAGLYAARWLRNFRAKCLPVLWIGLLASVGVASAQVQVGERVWSVPQSGNFWSMQRPQFPPLPSLPFDVTVYRIVGQTNAYAYDDRSIDYDQIAQPQAAQAGSLGLSPAGSGPIPMDYPGLWLEITGNTPASLSLIAHNVDVSKWFELESTIGMRPQPVWTIEQQIVIPDGTDLSLTVAKDGRPKVFFRAAQSQTRVWVTSGGNEIRPGPCYLGQSNYFAIQREIMGTSEYTELPVYYQVSGTASNGVDYLYLTGSVTIPEFANAAYVEVVPLPSLVTSNMTVTLTLLPGAGYLVDTNPATILIEPNVFSLVANVPNPVGLDYHTLRNSLLVSVDPSLAPGTNFVRIDTNGLVSLWADVADLYRPVPIATVKATGNGFTNGDMYYGITGLYVGRLSADGSQYDNHWSSLSGYLTPVGGLYVDQSGTFDGDLIATTGGDYTGSGDPGSVWRINSYGSATLATNFPMSLGGVITLTNDVAQWGPWAGKIITGQGPEDFLDDPQIYAVDTNGQAITFHLGIQPEHFNLIPPNQPFYCCDSLYYAVWKVPAAVFTNHVGQLLITGMGQVGYDPPPALYIVHWDAGVSNFVLEKIDTPDFVGCLEDGTFAPMEVPCLAQ